MYLFWAHYRLGLVELVGTLAFPDIVFLSSCLVVAAYFGATFFTGLTRPRHRLVLFGVICGALSVLCVEVPPRMGLFSSLWSVVGAVLFALYLITCWVLWFALFRRQGITTAVIYVLLSMVLSHGITWFILGMEGVRATWALLSVVVLSAIPLLEGQRKLPAEGRVIKETGPPAHMLARFALVT
ncbi:MAG: hypothetical protein LBS98_05755, partial [Coriobacteriales bacterium]|nr:hypothetical protein [Coriobacteriales bacterium]